MSKNIPRSVRLKNLLFAVLISLPLGATLILPPGTLNGAIDGDDLMIAAPFVVEFMGFYFLYVFMKGRVRPSPEERKLLIMLVSGIFTLLSLPVIITLLAKPSVNIPSYYTLLILLYSYASLIINTRAVSGSATKIKKYFFSRYIKPGALSISAVIVVALFTGVELNFVSLYLIIKSYAYALGDHP